LIAPNVVNVSLNGLTTVDERNDFHGSACAAAEISFRQANVGIVMPIRARSARRLRPNTGESNGKHGQNNNCKGRTE
jgi:hypothetical protein